MSRVGHERLNDILIAGAEIESHVARGSLEDTLIFDAVRIRLIEIGEAVKDLGPEILLKEPSIPWRDIAAMRDHLTHRSFDTEHTVVRATVVNDLPELLTALGRLLEGETTRD